MLDFVGSFNDSGGSGARRPARAVAAGPVPRLIEVKAENGKVTLPIIRTEKQNMNGAAPAVPPAVAQPLLLSALPLSARLWTQN